MEASSNYSRTHTSPVRAGTEQAKYQRGETETQNEGQRPRGRRRQSPSEREVESWGLRAQASCQRADSNPLHEERSLAASIKPVS